MIKENIRRASEVGQDCTLLNDFNAEDGETDIKVIRNFVDNEFLARDARDLRKYIRKIQPDVDLTFEIEDKRGNLKEIEVPVGIGFFWPDADV